MAADRSATDIQADIERARDQLAVAVDQLAERLAPQRLTDQFKATVKEKASSPAGRAAIGVGAAVIALLVARNLRRSKR